MKSLRWMIAFAALPFTMPAQAAVGDPPIVIYRASGVIDDNAGFSTAVFCTNFSGVTETLTVVVRGATSTIAANVNVNVPTFNTVILATRDTQLLTETTNMATGVINAGTVGIAATSVNFVCTVSLLQFQTSNPIMAPLHMLRFSPIPGTQE
jgi:hypothetical protein